MALVMVSGLPCSGRTTRSRELLADFARRMSSDANDAATASSSTSVANSASASSSTPRLRLVHLTNVDANVSRDDFTTQLREKPARAAYLSLVMRHLARDAIVVADGGAGTNIKGFRYQLWCAAREVGVRCVSVLCVAGPGTCKARNAATAATVASTKDGQYDDTALDELLMRFEEPNPMTRWDAPLFVLDCNPQATTSKESSDENARESWEPAPLDDIWQAVTQGDVNKAPDVVAPIRATTGNYLSLLESTTQAVLTALQALAASGTLPEMGGQVHLSVRMQHASTTTASPAPERVALHLPAGKRTPSTATLQRLRRQFVKMHASSAASQNEIGFAMGQEGSSSTAATVGNGKHNGSNEDRDDSTTAAVPRSTSAGNFRAQRKAQQQHGGGGGGGIAAAAKANAPRTPEQEIAHRFVAYLEETL